MNKKIEKWIEISAPKEKVWKVLFNDEFNRMWYAEFMEGCYAETDWKVGSKVMFKDENGSGLVGKIIKNKPYEVVSIEYDGVLLKGGIEDYESEIARQVKGTHENYFLSEKNGVTHVAVECEMSEAYFEMMSLAWDKAMLKIKELSESHNEVLY